MKKTVIFYFLCIITLFLFIIALHKTNKVKPYITPVYNTMNIVINTQTTAPTDIIVKSNDEYSEISKSRNIINKTLKRKIKTLDILINDNFKNKIEDIIIYNDIKSYYYKDFSNFEKEKIELCPIDKCYTYTKYTVPSEVKYNKSSDTYNYRGLLNHICYIILTVLSGSPVFFIPYIMLFISMIYFINNKEEIKKPKINIWFILVSIFIIFCLLRINGLFSYEPWADEYWSLYFSNPNSPISRIFEDPGNPPLFYLISKIWIMIFGDSLFSIKILPFTISVLGLFTLLYFLYKTYGKKGAILGFFLISINAPLIYYSGEFRGYILQAFFTPLLIYFLFKILDKPAKKDFIIYGVFVALVSNLHYYEILFIIANFIYGSIFLIIKKRKEDFLKFFIANLCGGLFVFPFFIKTALNKALLAEDFNTWLPSLTFVQIKTCVYYIFGGAISLLLSFIFFISAIFNKKNKNIVLYSFLTIWLVILMAVLLSYLIRPMLLDRYFLLLVPVFIIFLVGVLTSYQTKYVIVLGLFWVLLIQANTIQKSDSANSRKMVLEIPYSIANQYPKTENIYVITNTFLEEQKKYSAYNEKVKYFVSSVKSINEDIENILKKDKNAVILTGMIPPNSVKEIKNNQTCYFNAASDMCLWKIKRRN